MTMKKYYGLALLILLLCQGVFAGDGSENSPYSVAEAIKVKNQTQKYWVKGYIVGEMRDYSNDKYFYEMAPPFGGTAAYLIADRLDELNPAKCMPVQSGDYEDLVERPEYWRKEVLLCGNLKPYFTLPGVKNLSDFKITSSEPWQDETLAWNFYEDMDSKTYEPFSNVNTFDGGYYTGEETGEWSFKGATWGDTGKDRKWGRASARIRLTEGAAGSAGHIQMEFDKPDGIGVVRLWAGNYEEDSSGGALALFVSSDQGGSWQKVAHSQSVKKQWMEYQFAVNRSGNLRLRIAKDETGSKGINVDNIRISDCLSGTTGMPETALLSDVICYTSAEGVFLKSRTEAVRSLNIYTVAGSAVLSGKTFSGEQFIPLPRGIYLLNIDKQTFKITVL